MQHYTISGEWEREGSSKRWLEWSSSEMDAITGWFEVKGRRIKMFSSDALRSPDAVIAKGRVDQLKLLRSTDDGEWGSNPGVLAAGGDASAAVVDVWGDGINKLASLMVTNRELYDSLFGL